jgi:outer membrane protein TolC
MDLLPGPHRGKDREMTWKAINAAGKRIENGEKKEENARKQQMREETFRARTQAKRLPLRNHLEADGGAGRQRISGICCGRY